MNKRGMRNAVIGAVGLLLAAKAVHDLYRWQASRPTEANFDRALRVLMDKGRLQAGDYSGAWPGGDACVNIPLQPAPDARSRSSRPLAWHMDFLEDAPEAPARAQQIRQLNALAGAGLLARTSAAIERDGEFRTVTRYSLTEEGWAASTPQRHSTCLVYGKPQYLGITRFAPRVLSTEAGLDVYEVHARTGFRSASDLAPWARDPAILAAFPEISERIGGKEMSVLLVRGDGNWTDYLSLLRGMRTTRPDTPPPSEKEREAMARLEKEHERRIAAARKLAPPTVDEIKALLSAQYGPGAASTWPAPCLALPGSGKLPVDKRLSSRRPAHYAVAIFQDKERRPHDPVAGRTMPYLDMLERLGVVSKRTEQRVAGEGRDRDAVFEAHVYELTPEYAARLDPDDPDCFPLGEPEVAFVDVRVTDADLERSLNPGVSYKLRIRYADPPRWMRDPALQAGWEELRGVIERGRACDGRFEFDLEARRLMGGGGTCWWAFDSPHEAP